MKLDQGDHISIYITIAGELAGLEFPLVVYGVASKMIFVTTFANGETKRARRFKGAWARRFGDRSSC